MAGPTVTNPVDGCCSGLFDIDSTQTGWCQWLLLPAPSDLWQHRRGSPAGTQVGGRRLLVI